MAPVGNFLSGPPNCPLPVAHAAAHLAKVGGVGRPSDGSLAPTRLKWIDVGNFLSEWFQLVVAADT